MKQTIKQFSHLQIYRNLSSISILNMMFCNRLMTKKSAVALSPQIYKLSCNVLGNRLVDKVIQKTFGKALTAGNSLQEAERISKQYRDEEISIILDYCAEGVLGQANSEILLDETAKLFEKSANALSKNLHQMISIKITGLIDMQILKDMNDAVLLRNKFWTQNSTNGVMTGEQLFTGLQKLYNGISDDNFTQYLSLIHGYNNSPQNFTIDQIDFKMKHHPIYIQNMLKNENKIIRLFLPLTPDQMQKVKNFVSRIQLICGTHANNLNGFKILVDAEQSYLQRGIQCLSEQLQEMYNKEKLFIIPTLQNYLKCSVDRSNYEIQIAKRKNLVFGAKLVRGAYLVEQSKLAQENGTENPIVDCFQKTTQNYLYNFETMTKSFDKGEVVVATHNKDTIYDTAKIYNEKGSKIKVCYAQLLGLADHLTFKSKQDGFRVYKYLPYAKVSVMVPYMIRRAEQLSQMRYPLDTQYYLLRNQLKKRIFRFK